MYQKLVNFTKYLTYEEEVYLTEVFGYVIRQSMKTEFFLSYI